MFGTKPQTSKSGPPARAPLYAEPLLGEDSFLEPDQALRLFCHQLKAQLEVSRLWMIAGIELICTEVTFNDGKLHASFLGKQNRETSTLSVEQDGRWIRLEVAVSAMKQQFFVERVYEDWELWPNRSPGNGEAPGRIGKRMQWAQLELSSWPELVHFADNGVVTIKAAD